MRFLISNNHINPIAWEVSKVEDTFPDGVTFITLKQDLFNPKTDNKELMIADYYSNPVPPTEEPSTGISYNGQAELKVGGSYKTFTYQGNFTDEMCWHVEGLPEDKICIDEDGNTIKIQVVKDYALIGSTLTLSVYKQDKELTSIQIGVVSL